MKLTLADRVDVLFRALHSPGENEPTAEFVAEALWDRGVKVSAQEICALRAGGMTAPAVEVLAALAQHFHQQPWFLLEAGDSPRVVDTYMQLDLLRALRDAGVRRVRLRGSPENSDRRALIDLLFRPHVQRAGLTGVR